MKKNEIVEVAYVTKWATTQGILVVRGAEVTEGGYLRERPYLHVSARHWTSIKKEAERRYMEALERAERSAERKVESVRRAITAGPKYTERTPGKSSSS